MTIFTGANAGNFVDAASGALSLLDRRHRAGLAGWHQRHVLLRHQCRCDHRWWGDDTVFGGMGEDALEGGDGSDVLYGGGGNDTLSMTGTRLVDQQFGGGGNDYLTGSDGNEIFEGGAGVDSIYGGNGLEVIRILDHPDIDFVAGGGALATGSTRWNRVSSRRGGRWPTWRRRLGRWAAGRARRC